MLWKVSLMSGKVEPLTDFRAKWAAISTDGSRIAYMQMADGTWHIGVISSSGGAELQRLATPADLRESTIHWAPDNQALFYISGMGNIGNIRALPLDGTVTQPITTFTTQGLTDFALSTDGKRLAVTRTLSISDVVLIEHITSP
jgi:Tol biopolymer transport system component